MNEDKNIKVARLIGLEKKVREARTEDELYFVIANETRQIIDYVNSFLLLKTPTDNLLKEIYVKMGGKRSTERILSQIKDLVNSTSLKTALEKVIQHEVSSSNSGIITTEEEIKAFNVIKTIIALSSKINNKDLERVSFRDLKGSFTILVDENQNKKICALILKERSKSIVINSSTYNLQDTTVVSLTKFKKELIDSAISKLG